LANLTYNTSKALKRQDLLLFDHGYLLQIDYKKLRILNRRIITNYGK